MLLLRQVVYIAGVLWRQLGAIVRLSHNVICHIYIVAPTRMHQQALWYAL